MSEERRAAAALKYRPEQVKCLLVAEAPPTAPDRYFYFEDVREQDSLFRYVAQVVLGAKPTRENKPAALRAIRDLIDLSEGPKNGVKLRSLVPGLVQRVAEIGPVRIILIKTNVFDLAYPALRAVHLPVVDARIPFPGQGWQSRFVEAFSDALHAELTQVCSDV
jgi:hypothetical protein